MSALRLNCSFSKSILLFVIIFLFTFSFQEVSAKNKTLTILNWAEYIDPDLVKKFEAKNQVKIKQVYFETDDSRDAIMLANKGRGYDIVIVNGAKVHQYVKRGWIAPLTKKQVKNIKHIHPKWFTSFPSASGYAIPYFWGTLGIAYRSDLVKKPLKKWIQLFEANDDIKGKILMVRSIRELVGIALKAKGYSMNSTNIKELDDAYDLLIKQKKFVKDYSYLSLNEKSSIVQGGVVVAATYNGDAIAVQEHSDKIEFIVPEEGTNLWADYLTVSIRSQNKKLAYRFINFLNKPKNAAQLAQFVYFASPNKSAEKYLPNDFKSDKTIYPDKETLDKSEIFKPLPPRVIRKYNSIYSNIVNQ